MPNIFTDLSTAIRLTDDIRKERKAGYDVRIEKVRRIPVIRTGYWGWTPEACLFYAQKWKPVRDVFQTFPKETQHALTFIPRDDEWSSRIALWEEPLRKALSPDLYLEAMAILCDWALRCMKRRAGEAELKGGMET